MTTTLRPSSVGDSSAQDSYQQSISAAADTGVIYIDGQCVVSIGLLPATGATTSKWTYTLSPKANVDAGTAVWSDWAYGGVAYAAGYKDDVFNGYPTAIRGYAVGGATTFVAKVRAK